MGKDVVGRKATKCQTNEVFEGQEHGFLIELVKMGVLELKPTLDKSGIRYVDAESLLESVDSVTVKKTLEALAGRGVLKSKVLERVLLCPRCESPEVHSKFLCPRCSYDGVSLTQLLEHKTCGYIGARSDFLKSDSLVCPRCETDISEDPVSYRVIGNFYQCEKCGNRFDKPEVLHVCQNCGKSSTFQEAKYVKVFSYSVGEEMVRQFGEELPILENVRKLLMNLGFRVTLNSKVVGSSGVQSSFDVLAESGNVRLVFDVSVEGNKKDIVGLLAKKVDVDPTRAVILDLSGGDELTLLGKIYDITVFRAAGGQNVPDGFEGFLATLIPKKA